MDRQGENSYVVAPPSIHQSGGVYSWDVFNVPLYPLEAWALEVGSLLKPGTRPRRGDWIVYRWGADDWPDHIGVVSRVVSITWRGSYAFGTVRTIEGNVDDAVRRKYRTVRRARFVRIDAKKLTPVE